MKHDTKVWIANTAGDDRHVSGRLAVSWGERLDNIIEATFEYPENLRYEALERKAILAFIDAAEEFGKRAYYSSAHDVVSLLTESPWRHAALFKDWFFKR